MCFSLTFVYSRMPSRNRLIADQWALIKDIVGSPTLWPINIRRFFWTKHLTHFQRFQIACFVYVNGLSPETFVEWANLLNLCRDQSARNHFTFLFNSFEQGQYGDRYYAYNVSNRRYEFLNGTPRHYEHRDSRN